RGLLDETIVIWGGEFGRTPVADGRYPDKPAGRDHNPYGFTTWLAGAGIKGGKIIGATDEFGLRAVQERVHVNDLHATVLSLLGLDHRKLTPVPGSRSAPDRCRWGSRVCRETLGVKFLAAASINLGARQPPASVPVGNQQKQDEHS